jgi:hypothetical protein
LEREQAIHEERLLAAAIYSRGAAKKSQVLAFRRGLHSSCQFFTESQAV